MTGDILLQAFIARRQMLRDAGFTGLRVIGSRYDRNTFRVRDFLSKNRILFTWLDLESDAEVRAFLESLGFTDADTPVVAIGKTLLRNPTNRELADAIGIHRPLDHVVYDLAIAGGGPSGLAAAVYRACQAAIILAPAVKKINLMIRGDSLEKYMSSYLIRRIEQADNIECSQIPLSKRWTGRAA